MTRTLISAPTGDVGGIGDIRLGTDLFDAHFVVTLSVVEGDRIDDIVVCEHYLIHYN